VIGIIDYGMGNLHSVRKAFENIGAPVEIITSAEQIRAAEKIVLPGVGACRDAIQTLREKELVPSILETVQRDTPFLGICLGLQMLFDVSYEDGEYLGLGIIPGKVIRFDFSGRTDEKDLKIPHMGWNQLRMKKPSALYRDVPDGTYVYFVHSYYVVPENESVIATTTEHGVEFVSSIQSGNLYAVQFHPEKSQAFGLKMLENFANI